MSKFSLVLDGKSFESNDDGLLDLNDIWRGCELDEKKRPGRWDSHVSKTMKETGNIVLHSTKTTDAVFTNKRLVATEVGTIAYAMWVDIKFYMTVVEAFVALRNGEIGKALELSNRTMVEADKHYLQRQRKIKGMTFDEACAYAGIYHPRKVKQMLVNHPKFEYFDEKYVVSEVGEDVGYFYNRGNRFRSSTQLRVTTEGREWLRENRNWFNKRV